MIPINCIGKKLNKPFKSKRKNKKLQVCVREDGRVYNVHFGDSRYQDYTTHRDKKRRKNFRARHRCDKASDRKTPRYWACKELW